MYGCFSGEVWYTVPSAYPSLLMMLWVRWFLLQPLLPLLRPLSDGHAGSATALLRLSWAHPFLRFLLRLLSNSGPNELLQLWLALPLTSLLQLVLEVNLLLRQMLLQMRMLALEGQLLRLLLFFLLLMLGTSGFAAAAGALKGCVGLII